MNAIVPQAVRARVATFVEKQALQFETDRVRMHPEQLAQFRTGPDSMLDSWQKADNSSGDLNPEPGVYERNLEGTNTRLRIELSQQDETRSAFLTLHDQESGVMFDNGVTYIQSDGTKSYEYMFNPKGNSERAYVLEPNDGYFLLGVLPEQQG